MEPAGHPGAPARGFLRVGGSTLLRHQLSLALALGCERVVCLAPALDPALLAVQHQAEVAGARFHVVPGVRGLAALVSAADEVIALADGLLAWPDLAVALLGVGAGVLVQPIEAGLGAGFERIDLNHASAGALRVPGALIDRLAEMPADCDVFSALQRVALQGQITQRMLPAEVYESGRWSLVRDEAEAHRVEDAWIRLHTVSGNGGAPSDLLARQVVRRLGPALLHGGGNGVVLAVAALCAALLGLIAGFFGFPAVGLGVCVLGWVLFATSALLGRIERESLQLPPPALERADAFAWAMDAVLVMLLAEIAGAPAGQGWWGRLFAPVMLLGLARLLPGLGRAEWAGWLGDRAILAGALTLAALAGQVGGAVTVLAVAYLGIALVLSRQQRD